jgi:site-specific recombinase XerD
MIRQRGDSWQVDLRVRGKRVRRDFDSKGSAEAWETLAKARVQRGESIDQDGSGARGGDLKALLESTVARYWRGSKSEVTAEANAWQCVDLLGPETSPADVTDARLEWLIVKFQDKAFSNATINRKLSALSKMLRHAVKLGWITAKPSCPRLKESKGRLYYYSTETEAKVVAWFRETRPSMADLFEFLVDTGFRISEAVALEWTETLNDQVIALDRKNGDDGAVPMTDRVRLNLTRRKLACPPDETRVFWDLDYWSAQFAWRQAKAFLKLEEAANIHACRHTFCSRLVQAGVPILAVQQLAGHKTLAVTMRYAHLRKDDHRDAIKKLNRGVA